MIKIMEFARLSESDFQEVAAIVETGSNQIDDKAKRKVLEYVFQEDIETTELFNVKDGLSLVLSEGVVRGVLRITEVDV